MPLVGSSYSPPTGCTADELVDDVISEATAWGGAVEQMTVLTSPLNANDLTMSVETTTGFAAGLVEIGNELVYIKSVVDASTLSILQRGYRSTASTAHAAGSLVVRAPRFPRAMMLKLLNKTVGGLWPALYVVKTDRSNLVLSVDDWYPLPEDVEMILDVQVKDALDRY